MPCNLKRARFNVSQTSQKLTEKKVSASGGHVLAAGLSTPSNSFRSPSSLSFSHPWTLNTGPCPLPERASCLRSTALAGTHPGRRFYRTVCSPAATLCEEVTARLQRPVGGPLPSVRRKLPEEDACPCPSAQAWRCEAVMPLRQVALGFLLSEKNPACVRTHAPHSRSSRSQTPPLVWTPQPYGVVTCASSSNCGNKAEVKGRKPRDR